MRVHSLRPGYELIYGLVAEEIPDRVALSDDAINPEFARIRCTK